MAGSNVNVFFSSWQATGTNVSTPQYRVVVQVDWTDANGVQQTATRTVLFPNFLAQVPAAWVKEEMEQLMVKAARKLIRVDD